MSASGACPLGCQTGLDTRWCGVWESGWVTACSYRRGLLENKVGGTPDNLSWGREVACEDLFALPGRLGPDHCHCLPRPSPPRRKLS